MKLFERLPLGTALTLPNRIFTMGKLDAVSSGEVGYTDYPALNEPTR